MKSVHTIKKSGRKNHTGYALAVSVGLVMIFAGFAAYMLRSGIGDKNIALSKAKRMQVELATNQQVRAVEGLIKDGFANFSTLLENPPKFGGVIVTSMSNENSNSANGSGGSSANGKWKVEFTLPTIGSDSEAVYTAVSLTCVSGCFNAEAPQWTGTGSIRLVGFNGATVNKSFGFVVRLGSLFGDNAVVADAGSSATHTIDIYEGNDPASVYVSGLSEVCTALGNNQTAFNQWKTEAFSTYTCPTQVASSTPLSSVSLVQRSLPVNGLGATAPGGTGHVIGLSDWWLALIGAGAASGGASVSTAPTQVARVATSDKIYAPKDDGERSAYLEKAFYNESVPASPTVAPVVNTTTCDQTVLQQRRPKIDIPAIVNSSRTKIETRAAADAGHHRIYQNPTQEDCGLSIRGTTAAYRCGAAMTFTTAGEPDLDGKVAGARGALLDYSESVAANDPNNLKLVPGQTYYIQSDENVRLLDSKPAAGVRVVLSSKKDLTISGNVTPSDTSGTYSSTDGSYRASSRSNPPGEVYLMAENIPVDYARIPELSISQQGVATRTGRVLGDATANLVPTKVSAALTNVFAVAKNEYGAPVNLPTQSPRGRIMHAGTVAATQLKRPNSDLESASGSCSTRGSQMILQPVTKKHLSEVKTGAIGQIPGTASMVVTISGLSDMSSDVAGLNNGNSNASAAAQSAGAAGVQMPSQ